jgi:radical SAM/Cys-rich protein
MHAILPLLRHNHFPDIARGALTTLQVNLGYRCNQSCLHCHVAASPTRTEEMDRETIDTVIAFLQAAGIETLDLTGGAPELNPHFRYLVSTARGLGVRVIDRCNLTILDEPGQQTLADFLAAEGVEVVASLPCYLEDNVNRQRGKGVFGASIRGLQRLNALGYGHADSGLDLKLVFNPQGPVLPPPQAQLEIAYRTHLLSKYGIVFNQLLTLTNMPIQRFGSTLVSKGQFGSYMQLLHDNFSHANLASVMCRSLISVGYDGRVYDCDFNQMLGLPLELGEEGDEPVMLADLIGRDLENNPIVVRDHCFGCTAGQGSSCGGALSKN